MAATEKTVSGLINRQLPDFIRADHPKFQQFVEHYYKWLESDGTFTVGANTYNYGNTVYHIMNAEKYRDIDETLDPFIRLFKEELLPYFPENTELDLAKILKGAREFYVEKGSEDSLKWLFRVLFNTDIEVFYPKKQILIASDGKWKLPQAFQLTLSAANESINPNLLEKRKGTGSESKATCVVESANKTVDSTFGNEILEIYVSNVYKEFTNGENLEIIYEDENGTVQTFSEKIVGALSGIRVDSNIKTDPTQKRRGLLYNVGDPVVVFGGLDNTLSSNDAVAIVGNVTVGSIEAVTPIFRGYGYRTYSNTEVVVYRSVGDDPNANLSTDIRVAGINTTSIATNSQNSYREEIIVDKMPIDYLEGVALNQADYAIFTQNNRNIIVNATEADATDIYYNNEDVYANGASYQTANFIGKILTANSSGFGQGGAAYTGALALYSVGNTVPLNTTGFLVGQLLYTANTNKSFTINSITTSQLAANINSKLVQVSNFETIETGGIALFNVINGGFGFRTTPTIEVSSYFDTYLSENYNYETEYADKKQWRQPMGGFGQIAHVYINNGGSGYANGDAITVNCGQGYGFTGYVNVNSPASGVITRTTITNRGEGYFGTKSVTITSTGGNGAVLAAYGFGEGETHAVTTGAIGRIKDFRILSRGFEYISAPLVSLKVVDMVINAISESEDLTEGEKVYQGGSLETATFFGIVKEYNRTTKTLRLFNYSGTLDATSSIVSEGGVTFTIDLAARVIAPSQYPAQVIADGLPNPWFYGNGRAKGVAEFFNGLIKFPGFYLNTDGFLSADKKLQDDKVYHNFSYIIQSEKSLSEYKNPVKDIVHPVGMSMLGRAVISSEAKESVTSDSVVYINPANAPSSNVSVADSEANVVSGTSTLFNTAPYQANVDDIFVITDPNNLLRSQAKIITAVNSDTELEVEGDFTFIGQGKARITDGAATMHISGNTNSISQFIQTNDEIRFNIATANLFVAQTGTVQMFTANGKVVGTSTQFTTQLAVNDIIRINNDIRKVVNIASATVMNVNAAFSEANTGKTIEKLATVMTVNVLSISANVITTNTTMQANASNLVYIMIPDYNTQNYDYEIITVTED